MFVLIYITVYTLSAIHMLETVAKPMLQMLETQRESSMKKIQILRTKLEQLSSGINNDDYFCDGTYNNDNDQKNVPETKANLSDDLSLSQQLNLVGIKQPNEIKKEKKSSMVSSPV